ncbi:hypothetical protein BBJ28_00020099 [Nothophytophthora sp. Chile5]|nr:hypothetical protein BBJ28_00020099 [Nothophytophthora sp. Chile5]
MMEKEKTIGGLLLLASVLTTCVYESRLVRDIKSFEEGRSVVASLPQPAALERNDGALVHFSGLITTTAALPSPAHAKAGGRPEIDHSELRLRLSPFVLDPAFGIAVKGVKLQRQVEMLQWVESSHTSTSSTPEDEDRRMDDDRERIYMYDLRWRSEVIDSSAFNDMSYWNPPEVAWVYTSLVVKAPDLVVGDFPLPDELVDQIQRTDRVTLDGANRRVMANVLSQRQGEGWEAASALQNVTVEENYLYLRNEPREPVLGDLRVFLEVTPNYPVSVCAVQQQGGKRLVPFVSTAGEKERRQRGANFLGLVVVVQMRKNRFFRLFASVLGFIGFLVLRAPLVKRFGPLLAGAQQHLLASSLGVALTFSVVGANWILYR